MLELASKAYKGIMITRNWLYDRKLLNIYWPKTPVIAIGNLTTGGTGKTPTAIAIAKMTENHFHIKPAIILRGYKQSSKHPSDELLVYKNALPARPIIANADRQKAAKLAIKEGAKVIIADDAFQHRRLGRDLNIVLIDAINPFDNRRLIPAGKLREPLSALRRADLLIITRANLVKTEDIEVIKKSLRAICDLPIGISYNRPLYFITHTGDKVQINELKGKNVLAFAGIGQPDSFIRLLRQEGINIQGLIRFPDHKSYSTKDLVKIKDKSKSNGTRYLVCTVKDMVKITSEMLYEADIAPEDLLALQIELEFEKNTYNMLLDYMKNLLKEFSSERIKQICQKNLCR